MSETTLIEALTELAAKVEAGSWWGDIGICSSFCAKSGFTGRHATLMTNVMINGSLDAVKALHGSVLPGYTRSVDATAPECGVTVELHPVDDKGNPVPKPIISADMPCEARAWLLAIIRALIAQEQT